MVLNTNLATRSYVNVRQMNFALAVIIIILLLWFVFNINGISRNHGEIKHLESEVSSLDKKLTGDTKGIQPKDYELLLAKIRFANAIIDRKSMNWIQFLDQLESAVPDGIALSTVDPDVQKDSLKLIGFAKNFASLRNFFEILEASPYYSNVFLDSQSEVKVGLDQKGVAFTITCKVKYNEL